MYLDGWVIFVATSDKYSNFVYSVFIDSAVIETISVKFHQMLGEVL